MMILEYKDANLTVYIWENFETWTLSQGKWKP